MRTLAIGLEGNLNGETLTIVSFNNQVFKCDNGKTYLVAKSTWMTNPEIIEAIASKPKKATNKAVKELTEEQKERLSYLKATGNDMQSIMDRSTANYRSNKAGASSLTK